MLRVDEPVKGIEPRTVKLAHSAVSPNGLIAATCVRDERVKTATLGGAHVPAPAELARREMPRREGATS